MSYLVNGELMNTKQKLNFKAESRAQSIDRSQDDLMRQTTISNFSAASSCSIDEKDFKRAVDHQEQIFHEKTKLKLPPRPQPWEQNTKRETLRDV